MRRGACSCLPSWLLPRPRRLHQSKAEDTTASATGSGATCGSARRGTPPLRAATAPIPQARSRLAEGDASRTLFRAATAIRSYPVKGSTGGAPIRRWRTEEAGDSSRPPKGNGPVPAGGRGGQDTSDTTLRAPLKGSSRFNQRNPHSSSLQKRCWTTKQSPSTVSKGDSTLLSIPGEEGDHEQVQEPYAIKIRFGRLFDIPVTKEGDIAGRRKFYCFVYFEHEDPSTAAADPRRCTQHNDAYYSGCTHYEIPLGGEVIEIPVPGRRNSSDSYERRSNETNTSTFVGKEQSAPGGVLFPTRESAEELRAGRGHLHAGTNTTRSVDHATEEGGADRKQRVLDTAAEAAEEQGKLCGHLSDQSVTSSLLRRNGTSTISLRHATARIRGFHVGVIEELPVGPTRVMKGTTALLPFSDPQLLEPQKWPMMNITPTARTAAGAVYMRCQVLHAIPVLGAKPDLNSCTGSAVLEIHDGARSDVAGAGASASTTRSPVQELSQKYSSVQS